MLILTLKMIIIIVVIVIIIPCCKYTHIFSISRSIISMSISPAISIILVSPTVNKVRHFDNSFTSISKNDNDYDGNNYRDDNSVMIPNLFKVSTSS